MLSLRRDQDDPLEGAAIALLIAITGIALVSSLLAWGFLWWRECTSLHTVWYCVTEGM